MKPWKPSSSSKQRKPLAIPCDQCRRRKIRCTYGNPCECCESSDISCSYLTERKKRGPKRGRGAVVEQIRASQAAASFSSKHTTSHTSPTTLSVVGVSPQHSLCPAQVISQGPATGACEPWSVLSARPENANEFHDQDAANKLWFAFDDFTQNILSTSAWPSVQTAALTVWSPAAVDVLSDSHAAHTHPPTLADTSTPASHLEVTESTLTTSNRLEVDELIRAAIQLFFDQMYYIYPLVNRAKVEALLQERATASKSDACLIWSISALTMMHNDHWPGLASEQRVATTERFIRRCKAMRLEMDFVENASYYDVLTSLFIGISLFELRKRKASWFHLREGITLAFAAKLDQADQDEDLEADERVRRMRAYALLCISERGACVLDTFKVSTVAMPGLPVHTCQGEDTSIAAGLQSLHSLFSMLDFNFVSLWNDPSRFASVDKGFPELAALQNHLMQPLDVSCISDIQKADVLITQQWLRLVFWQASLRQGLISTSSTHRAFKYDYPLEIASSLCQIVRSLPPVAIQVHGLGIFEKQFEIAYSLLDTITYSKAAQPVEHHENLRYLLLSLSASPSSRQIYVRTLEKKMGDDPAHRKYRSVADVQLHRDDTKPRSSSRRQSVSAIELGGRR